MDLVFKMKFSIKIIMLLISSVFIAVIFCIWFYGRNLCKGLNNSDRYIGGSEMMGISWDEVACSRGGYNYFDYGFRKIIGQI